MLKTAIRQFDWAATSEMFYQLYEALVLGFRSPAELSDVLSRYLRRVCAQTVTQGTPALEPHIALVMGEYTVNLGVFGDPHHLESALTALSAGTKTKLNEEGDTLTQASNARDSLDLRLDLGRENLQHALVPDVYLVARVHAPPPPHALDAWLKLLKSIRRLALISGFVEEVIIENKLDRIWPL